MRKPMLTVPCVTRTAGRPSLSAARAGIEKIWSMSYTSWESLLSRQVWASLRGNRLRTPRVKMWGSLSCESCDGLESSDLFPAFTPTSCKTHWGTVTRLKHIGKVGMYHGELTWVTWASWGWIVMDTCTLDGWSLGSDFGAYFGFITLKTTQNDITSSGPISGGSS